MKKEIQRSQSESPRGIRVSVLNGAALVMAAVITGLLLYSVYQTMNGYNQLNSTTEQYIACQQDALAFQESSDFLTSEARYFVMTGAVRHAQQFAEEVEVTKRRETAVNNIESLLKEEKSYGYLTQALQFSRALADVECYAMRLAAAAFDLTAEDLPALVMNVELTAEDAALTPDEQHTRSIDMLFDEEYQSVKANINTSVNLSIDSLVEDTHNRQIVSSEKLNRLLSNQRWMIIALVALLALIAAYTYALLIRPLERAVSRIRSHEQVPVSGAFEMQFFAATYNDMFDQNAKSTEKLTYAATHDSLTGIYNRSAYDAMIPTFDKDHIGVLIVDIDKFKDYNDNYGHDVGDQVLQKVASVLKGSFRSEDFVGRIGGDEFCVVLKNVTSKMRDMIQTKMEKANHRLQNPEDGIPKISLSIGVAFGDRTNPEGDIFKDADTALYRAKHAGQGNCVFFE